MNAKDIELQRAIKYAFSRAIPWRNGLQSRYPEDPRNPLAVELLTKFSADVDAMTPEQIGRVLPFYSWVDSHWNETLRAVVRRVGYRRTMKTFDDFVDTLVSYLQEEPKVAA